MANYYTRVLSINLSTGRSREKWQEVSEKSIVDKVVKEITKMNENGEFDIDKSPKNKKKNERKGWKTSELGITMYTGQLISSTARIMEAVASADSARIAETAYTTIKGNGTLALSTFGKETGAIMSTILNIVDGLVGDYIKNQIQIGYDNARLSYNLSRNDIGRNSMYVYDSEQQKWRARDTERIKKNVLNQNTSV